MMRLTSTKMILLAAGLMILGVTLPFLMVLHLLKSTFFLNFFAYALCTSGFFLGLIGAMTYFKEKKR